MKESQRDLPEANWFGDKLLTQATRQVRDTLSFLNKYDAIVVEPRCSGMTTTASFFRAADLASIRLCSSVDLDCSPVSAETCASVDYE
jgi:hypothetical protein